MDYCLHLVCACVLLTVLTWSQLLLTWSRLLLTVLTWLLLTVLSWLLLTVDLVMVAVDCINCLHQ